MQPKQWKDFTDPQKRCIVALGVLQLVLLAAALIDLDRLRWLLTPPMNP